MEAGTRHSPAAGVRLKNMSSHSGDTDGNELGQFLRARRAALDPRRAGLAPSDGLRRVAGLRREELAQLAHLSFDYIVRLGQGRTRRISPSVLNALADALQLTHDERAYLFNLADVAPRTAPGHAADPRSRPRCNTSSTTCTTCPR